MGDIGFSWPVFQLRNREQEGKLVAALARARRAAKRAARKQKGSRA